MSAIHTYPLNDWLPHNTDDAAGDCHCDPRVIWIDPETDLPWQSGDGPLIVHNAFDGRI